MQNARDRRPAATDDEGEPSSRFESLQLDRMQTLLQSAQSLLEEERRQRLVAEVMLDCLRILSADEPFERQCHGLFAAFQRVIPIDYALVLQRSGPEGLEVAASLPPGERRVVEACALLQQYLRAPDRDLPPLDGERALRVAHRLLAPTVTAARLAVLPVGRELAMLLIATEREGGYGPDDLTLLDRLEEVTGGLYRRDRLRESALHQARLASLGESMAVMLHQLAQPLNALGLSTQTAARMLQRNGDVEAALKSLRRQEEMVRRMGDLIRATQLWARPGNWKEVAGLLRAGACDLEELIAGARSLFEHRLGNETVGLRLTLDPQARRVAAHPLALEQVLTNLLKNALDSIREARQRTPATSPSATAEHWVSISSSAHPSLPDHLLLAIDDSGLGFPRHLLEVGPEQWLTSKPRGEGSGLGLALSDRLVREMGGELALAATADGGARVLLTLPRGGEGEPAVRF